MGGDTAFFLHNRLIFKRERPFQILFQPAQNDISSRTFSSGKLSARCRLCSNFNGFFAKSNLFYHPAIIIVNFDRLNFANPLIIIKLVENGV